MLLHLNLMKLWYAENMGALVIAYKKIIIKETSPSTSVAHFPTPYLMMGGIICYISVAFQKKPNIWLTRLLVVLTEKSDIQHCS